MTISDLSTAVGVKRRYFLRIDGIGRDFWQVDDSGTAPTDATTGHIGLSCLRVPQGHSMSLNFAEAKCELDQMTLEFDDVADTDGNSYFGKLFAVNAWENATHYRLAGSTLGTAASGILAANANYLPMADIAGVPAPSNTTYAYLGGEMISYTGTNATSGRITGVTRGLYPCITNGIYAQTLELMPYGAEAYRHAVSTVPFSLHGRRVALYVATQNAGTWVADAAYYKLLWCGRITDQVIFDPAKRNWTISCTSILADLEAKRVGVDMPKGLLKQDSVVFNDWPITFRDMKWSNTLESYGTQAYWTYQPENCYPGKAQIGFFGLDPSKWSNTEAFVQRLYTRLGSDGYMEFVLQASPDYAQHIKISFENGSHLLWGWGFKEGLTGGVVEMKSEKNGQDAVWKASHKRALTYIALNPAHNNSTLYLYDTDLQLWASQGDTTNTVAYVAIDDCNLDRTETAGRAVLAYRAAVSNNVTGSQLTLCPMPRQDEQENKYPRQIFALDEMTAYIRREGENFDWRNENPEVKQVYVPQSPAYLRAPCAKPIPARRSPFISLLYPLLSTGTTGYNSSGYDKLPFEVSAGIDAQIVDITSFLEADCSVAGFAADRRNYVISEPTSIAEMILRECKLFGYALVWRNGKITLRSINRMRKDRATLTLDDGTRARAGEKPRVTQTLDTVINQYEFKLRYDHVQAQYGRPIIISDMDSISLLRVTNKMTVEHPGVYFTQGDAEFAALLYQYAVGAFWRFPGTLITVSLAPYYLGRIFAGDTVRFQSSYVPSPTGNGTMTTDCYALVMNVQWNRDQTGSANLYLFPTRGSGQNSPWAPSALIADGTTKYNSETRTIVIDEDTFGGSSSKHDGARFKAGDRIVIVERCPQNIANAQSWGPLTLASDYDSDGKMITLAVGDELTGYSNTKEYVVSFANYSSCNSTSDQLDRGIWGCNASNDNIDINVAAYRWD